MKVSINVSLDLNVVRELDLRAASTNQTRSQLVDKLLRRALKLRSEDEK